jgi:hypothetical protein
LYAASFCSPLLPSLISFALYSCRLFLLPFITPVPS